MACGGWEGSVDSSQLEARLRVGLEADRRYATENAAKLRGIHSAPTYEEFRQLVLGKNSYYYFSLLLTYLWWLMQFFFFKIGLHVFFSIL